MANKSSIAWCHRRLEAGQSRPVRVGRPPLPCAEPVKGDIVAPRGRYRPTSTTTGWRGGPTKTGRTTQTATRPSPSPTGHAAVRSGLRTPRRCAPLTSTAPHLVDAVGCPLIGAVGLRPGGDPRPAAPAGPSAYGSPSRIMRLSPIQWSRRATQATSPPALSGRCARSHGRAVAPTRDQADLEGREAVLRRYGFAVPTEAALDEIAHRSPAGVVGLGAGVGYWAASAVRAARGCRRIRH